LQGSPAAGSGPQAECEGTFENGAKRQGDLTGLAFNHKFEIHRWAVTTMLANGWEFASLVFFPASRRIASNALSEDHPPIEESGQTGGQTRHASADRRRDHGSNQKILAIEQGRVGPAEALESGSERRRGGMPISPDPDEEWEKI
jgi:hypothetical protein